MSNHWFRVLQLWSHDCQTILCRRNNAVWEIWQHGRGENEWERVKQWGRVLLRDEREICFYAHKYYLYISHFVLNLLVLGSTFFYHGLSWIWTMVQRGMKQPFLLGVALIAVLFPAIFTLLSLPQWNSTRWYEWQLDLSRFL